MFCVNCEHGICPIAALCTVVEINIKPNPCREPDLVVTGDHTVRYTC